MAEIERKPGLRYRELIRATGLPHSTFALTVASLQKLDLVKVKKREGVTRFYPPHISDKECNILGHIYPLTSARLVSHLLENDDAPFKELVKVTAKAPATVSYYLKKLKKDGIVEERFYGNNKTFAIRDREELLATVKKYSNLKINKMS